MDERLIEGISDEDKLELFHSYKSNFQVRLVKRKNILMGKQINATMAKFHEVRGNFSLTLMNSKTCKIDFYRNSFLKSETFK
jgi:hypothetical protein